MNLNELVEKGKEIRAGIKYVPAEPGIIRTFSVYKLQDRMAYSSWKNQCILYLQNVLKDSRSQKRFEEEAAQFETHYYQPSYLENMIGIMDAYLQTASEKSVVDEGNTLSEKNSVFIVHGHNEGVNQEVARVIERLGLEAVILREQPNSGQTIIEKFESYANRVGFAVILLTADDKMADNDTFRARQNVIFEMGYFMGALGRCNVMCLIQNKVEKPGDIDGVVYTLIDQAGVWKFSLVKELKASGYDVDANAIM